MIISFFVTSGFLGCRQSDTNYLITVDVNSEIAAFQNLEAYQLVEAYKKDELKGHLKEIAAKLNEGSNPVIMIMKYKK